MYSYVPVPPSHSIQLNSSTFTFIDAPRSIFYSLNDNHPTAMYNLTFSLATCIFFNVFMYRLLMPNSSW